jgi:hypothetical protein
VDSPGFADWRFSFSPGSCEFDARAEWGTANSSPVDPKAVSHCRVGK